MPRIGVCLPTGDNVNAGFAKDLAAAVGHWCLQGNGEISLHTRRGTLLAEQRQELSRIAVEDGAEFVIFIDDDMRFPPDTFTQLVSHNEKFVAANCSKRRRPIGPTAHKAGEFVYPDPDKHGLEVVDAVGFGVACIRADVFKEIEWPWFALPWLTRNNRFQGEDLFFCARLHHAGIPVHIDHDLSWHIRHCGIYEWGMDDVLAERQLALAGEWDGNRDV